MDRWTAGQTDEWEVIQPAFAGDRKKRTKRTINQALVNGISMFWNTTEANLKPKGIVLNSVAWLQLVKIWLFNNALSRYITTVDFPKLI